MSETGGGPGDRGEEEPGNPYAMAMTLIRTGVTAIWAASSIAAARKACALLIEAYARDPGHVDWGDVQAALEEAMLAHGLSVHPDGRGLVLRAAAEAPAAGARPKPKPEIASHLREPPDGREQTSSVFKRGGEWWFYDEAGLENGPFADAVDAHLQVAFHLEFLEHGPQLLWRRMGQRVGNFIADRKRG